MSELVMVGVELAKSPRMLVAVALANLMARRLWAMMTKGEIYQIRGAT